MASAAACVCPQETVTKIVTDHSSAFSLRQSIHKEKLSSFQMLQPHFQCSLLYQKQISCLFKGKTFYPRKGSSPAGREFWKSGFPKLSARLSEIDSLEFHTYGLWNEFWRMKSHFAKSGVLFQVPSAGQTQAEEHLSHNFHSLKELFRYDKTGLILPIYAVSLI